MPYKNLAVQREYQRRWMAKRRAAWLLDKSCAKCGSVEDLEVDHIDPEQKVSHRIWSWSKARQEEELAKCQVLCGAHHKEKTYAQRKRKTGHGKKRMYALGCHCDLCKEAKRVDNARYRAKSRN